MKKTSPLLSLLFALASPLLTAQNDTFNVLDFGARNDGTAPSTEAFRKAIEACTKAGGGTVNVPAGNYISGHIELASNLDFHLQAGATIHFLSDLKEYPLVKGRYEGTETLVPSPLIGGRNLQNVAITGRGTLSAVNAEWRKLTAKPDAPGHVDQHSRTPRPERNRTRERLSESRRLSPAGTTGHRGKQERSY